MIENIVIIGAGQAAAQAIQTLRTEGYAGRIALIGEEQYLPYQRPPLSKKYLTRELSHDRLYLKPAIFYDASGVALRLGVTAEAIDRAAARVRLSTGESIPYDKLLIATGSRVRRLPCPGGEDFPKHTAYLRTLDDADWLGSNLAANGEILIAGGGYVGLEVAAAARKAGARVLLVEREERLLARVTSPTLSAFYRAEHERQGVEIRCGVSVAAMERAGGEHVHIALSDGSTVTTGLVVVGIGVVPNTELAAAAGLAVDNGIVVDDLALTTDPNIAAAGDCTNLPNAIYGRRVRLESVHNAIEQAKTAAASLLGLARAYAQVPWFWSDQYDLKLQMAGLAFGADAEVLRGDPESRRFSMLYLREGRLLAVDAVNAPVDYMKGRDLIARGRPLKTEGLEDPAVPLQDVA